MIEVTIIEKEERRDPRFPKIDNNSFLSRRDILLVFYLE